MKPLCWVIAVVFAATTVGCGARVIEETPFESASYVEGDAGPRVVAPTDAGRTDPDVADDTPRVAVGVGEAATASGDVQGNPDVADQGGPILAHPRVVTITYASDWRGANEEALMQSLAGGPWLHEVGVEYGVGEGSMLGTYRRDGPPPPALTAQEIEQTLVADIAARSIPTPPEGDYSDVLYVLFFPLGTTVSMVDGERVARSCQDFLGYHGAVHASVGRVSYVVAAECDDPQSGRDVDALVQITTSHEFIEAATDADPIAAPAYQLAPGVGAPWSDNGGEIADLCHGHEVTIDGFNLQRVWSNRLAALGGVLPCVPVAPPGP